jgi:hypothetical protein
LSARGEGDESFKGGLRIPATATSANRRTGAKPKLKLAVDFGGVSIGDGTASLGVTFDREKLDIDRAVECFCGRRITGTVLVGGGDPDQDTFWKDAEYRVGSTFDVKRIAVAPKKYSIRLTFALGEIEIDDLAHFAKKRGMLAIDLFSEIPAKATKETANGEGPDEDEEDDGDE